MTTLWMFGTLNFQPQTWGLGVYSIYSTFLFPEYLYVFWLWGYMLFLSTGWSKVWLPFRGFRHGCSTAWYGNLSLPTLFVDHFVVNTCTLEAYTCAHSFSLYPQLCWYIMEFADSYIAFCLKRQQSKINCGQSNINCSIQEWL